MSEKVLNSARTAVAALEEATQIARDFQRKPSDESLRDFNEDDKLQAAIDALIALKETLGAARDAIHSRIREVLESYEGEIASKERALYKDMATTLYGHIPEFDEYRKQYDVTCTIPNPTSDPDDTQTACVVKIRHYEDWGDGDGDYNKETTVTVKIPEGKNPEDERMYGEYEPEIVIEGEPLDPAFEEVLMAALKDPAYPPKDVTLKVSDIVTIKLTSTGGKQGKASLTLVDSRGSNYPVFKDLRPDRADEAFEKAIRLAEKRKIAGMIRDELQEVGYKNY